MNNKTKKFIAREGSIIIGIIVIGLLTFHIGASGLERYKNKFWKEIIANKEEFKKLTNEDQGEARRQYMEQWSTGPGQATFREYGFGVYIVYYLQFIGFWLLRLGYPFYWLIRFIFWAIKTVKQKSVVI
jgi:hypothetical protein